MTRAERIVCCAVWAVLCARCRAGQGVAQHSGPTEGAGPTEHAPWGSLFKLDRVTSFYSLHTALAATLSATAGYISIVREDPAWQRWLVILGGVAATSVTGLGRIFSGAHFTTDVVVGTVMGAGVGLLVPHLHRREPQVQATPWTDGHDGSGLRVSFRW
jgi:hypothetical protein